MRSWTSTMSRQRSLCSPTQPPSSPAEGLVCVDEYQRAPVVLDAIKAELNRFTRPARFNITGSARHESLPAAAQAVTGRLQRRLLVDDEVIVVGLPR